jgi:2'-5' RNA ligase
MGDEIRAFVAIELPTDVAAYLAETMNALKKCGGDVKWVRSESIHLTLKFLGPLSTDLLDKVGMELDELGSRVQPAKIALKGIGAFPNLIKPRVIWTGCAVMAGNPGKLVEGLERVFVKYGFPKEKRMFSPHFTLGRVRSGKGLHDTIEYIRSHSLDQGPVFEAASASLFQSVLKPSGAEYKQLHRFYFTEKS